MFLDLYKTIKSFKKQIKLAEHENNVFLIGIYFKLLITN